MNQKISEMLSALKGTKSINAFASELDISPSTLCRILTGKRGVGIRVMEKIVKKYPDFGDVLRL